MGTLAATADAYVHGLRWLAESVWPSGRPGLDLEAFAVRVNLDCPSTIRDYLLRCARSPRAGGTFDHVTASLRLLPDSLLLSALLRSRYSGLVFTRGEEVIGHVLDQQHGDTLHAFSIAVNAPLRKLCYAQVMLMDYVAYASQRDDIAALRLGRARNPFTRELLKTLGEHQQQLGWSVSADGWIEFSRSR